MEDFADDQEVIRTIGDLKKFASYNWWTGFASGGGAIVALLAIIAAIGLYYNI